MKSTIKMIALQNSSIFFFLFFVPQRGEGEDSGFLGKGIITGPFSLSLFWITLKKVI
jgi:hypothetical protein